MVSLDRPYVVLAVEDDENHAALIHAVFAYRDVAAQVRVTATAEEAIDYLLGRWPLSDRGRYPLPDVIVLDLNMPGMGGLGFLEWLTGGNDEVDRTELSQIPVVVFTSLEDPKLPKKCFALGAREFKTKPADFDELVDVVHRVIARWRPE